MNSRPELLSHFFHDIGYPKPRSLDEEAYLMLASGKEDSRLGSNGLVLNTFMLVMGAFATHRIRGSQLWVSKEVSYDLEHTDIEDPDFGSVTWPNEFLEVVFEDPSLPSTLIFRGPLDSILAAHKPYLEAVTNHPVAIHAFKNSTGDLSDPESSMIGTLCYGRQKPDKEPAYAFHLWRPETLNQFAHGEHTPKHKELDLALGAAHAEALRWLLTLVFKTLLFASTPQFVPTKTLEEPTRSQGGKSGFQNRPKRPRLLVEYLPQQRALEVGKARKETKMGQTHLFKGRRGVLRRYRHDRWVTMKGKCQFIPPIPGPDGTIPRRTFKVIKPKGGIPVPVLEAAL
jgi:hypothetical protein